MLISSNDGIYDQQRMEISKMACVRGLRLVRLIPVMVYGGFFISWMKGMVESACMHAKGISWWRVRTLVEWLEGDA